MFGDDADDEEPLGSVGPVPAEDRLWRHPSELGAGVAGVGPAASIFDGAVGALPVAPPPRPRRAVVSLVAVAGLIGATAAVAAVAVAGGLRPRVIERGASRTATAGVADIPTVSTRTVSSMVGALDRSVLRLEATVGGDTRRGAAVAVAEGVLVTSAGLVAGASLVTIRTPDGAVHDVGLVGTDPVTGIAVLELDGFGIVAAPTAGDRPHAGDTAVTVAGAADADVDVSMGVIASVGDTVDGPQGTLRDLISIDRPVPVGSDGAALLDGTGRVVGICLALDPPGAPRGYAVPVEVAVEVADDLVADGSVDHAWMGVLGVDLADRQVMELDLPGGGLLTEVAVDGPAALGGLRAGDVVVAMGDRAIGSISDLAVAIRDAEPGTEVEVVLVRDGDRRSVTIALGTAPR